MVYILLIIKSFITFLAVILAILSIFKEWKHHKRNTIKNKLINKYLIFGWIIFGFFSVLSIWITPNINNKIIKYRKDILKPDVTFEISEISNSQLQVNISTDSNNKVRIQTLNINFDLPGSFKSYNIKKSFRVGNCNVSNTLKNGLDSIITSEFINLYCENLNKNSFISILIDYYPTKPILLSQIDTKAPDIYYMPIMDLRDYSKCEYTWLYEGNEIVETEYIKLSDLDFIKKDNINMINARRKFEYVEKQLKLKNSTKISYKTKYTEDWLDSLEESRKDW